MGFSLKKALRKLDTGARRTMSGLDDARRGDVKGAAKNFKEAGSIAKDFGTSAFEQSGRDVRTVAKAHTQVVRDAKTMARATGHEGLDRFLDAFMQDLKKQAAARQTVKTPPPTLPVEPNSVE